METFREYLAEKFKYMGKLSNDELQKGQKLVNGKDDLIPVTGRVFLQAISKIRKNDMAKGDDAKGLETLSVYSVNEYNKMRCFLGANNSSGYALKGKDLVSVFSTEGSSSKSIMLSAASNGAKTLDCFAIRKNGKISGKLYELYSRYSWKIDTSMNEGKEGEAYSIVKGVSSFVDDDGVVRPDDERVVIFMKLG
jgi:hypothetical protein